MTTKKSSFPRTEKSLIRVRKNILVPKGQEQQRSRKSPSPSLAGQTAIVNQAVLLAPGHHSPASSRELSPSDMCRIARCYSGGTALASPTFLLSLSTPDPIFMRFSNIFHQTYRFIIAPGKLSVKRICQKILQKKAAVNPLTAAFFYQTFPKMNHIRARLLASVLAFLSSPMRRA